MSTTTLPRRDFLRAGAALGGGLLIAVHLPALHAQDAQAAAVPMPADGQATGEFAPNAFVRISPDGGVTVMINKAEMGQGVCTSLAMFVADELDADWTKVRTEFAPADPAYAHPGRGIQFTGGSSSVAGMEKPMRTAGATARAMLLQAAAKRWGSDAGACTTQSGSVIEAGGGRKATYGELVDDAAKLDVPKDVKLKEESRLVLIGKPVARLDTPDKVRGTAQFSIDVARPGMLTALVAHPPVFGARVRGVRSDSAAAIPGVRKVVTIPTGVAVIADGFWPAKQARDRLEIDWDLGENASLSTETLREQYRDLARTSGKIARAEGDAQGTIRSAAKVVRAEYEIPYLAHATMEPLNCVVDLRADGCDVWAGSQFQTFDHAAIAKTSGLDPKRVKLHTTYMGGGFGRRACPTSDFIVEGVEVAKHAGAPVKLIWTREDDMRAGYYRPMWASRLEAGIDRSGALAAWTHTLVGQSITAGTPLAKWTTKDGIDATSVEGAKELPYSIPNLRVDLHTTTVGVPVLWWRSVGHTHTGFVTESFLDEVAHALGADPFELRKKLLEKEKRHLSVLERVAHESGWSKKPDKGRARGIAVHKSFDTYVADVVEVSMVDGWPHVHKVTRAIDCGRVVNPDIVRAQLEGAAGFALTAALYGAITLKNGRVEQGNFHDYRMLRMDEMPAVDVHIVDSTEDSTGVGEPGIPTIAPALCNAIFTLTGKRVRRLPITKEALRA